MGRLKAALSDGANFVNHWGMERTLNKLSALLPQPRAALLAALVHVMSNGGPRD